MSYSKIRPRRDTGANWNIINPILLQGEIGIEIPEEGLGSELVRMKIGDGLRPWKELKYAVDGYRSCFIHAGTSAHSDDIWIRTDTHDNWYFNDPVLGLGEIVYDITYHSFKVGDNLHKYSELKFIGFSQNEYEDPDINWDFGDEDAIPNDSTIDEDFGDEDMIG